MCQQTLRGGSDYIHSSLLNQYPPEEADMVGKQFKLAEAQLGEPPLLLIKHSPNCPSSLLPSDKMRVPQCVQALTTLSLFKSLLFSAWHQNKPVSDSFWALGRIGGLVSKKSKRPLVKSMCLKSPNTSSHTFRFRKT